MTAIEGNGAVVDVLVVRSGNSRCQWLVGVDGSKRLVEDKVNPNVEFRGCVLRNVLDCKRERSLRKRHKQG